MYLIVMCLLLPSTALASFDSRQTLRFAQGEKGGPTFQVKAGFDGHYRDGNWVPVQVALSAVMHLPAVAAASLIPRAKVLELLEPWLGSGPGVSDLPLPRLVTRT